MVLLRLKWLLVLMLFLVMWSYPLHLVLASGLGAEHSFVSWFSTEMTHNNTLGLVGHNVFSSVVCSSW
jgi:hypothetical protein